MSEDQATAARDALLSKIRALAGIHSDPNVILTLARAWAQLAAPERRANDSQ